MIDVFVLNKALEMVGVVDAYKSLIWAHRYNTIGDCELYLPATTESLQLLQKGFYLARDDDTMVCQIRKIELDTSTEEGNYLIVTGVDVAELLDRRVVWSTMNANGNAETFIRNMVDKSLGAGSTSERQITNPAGARMFFLGEVAGFTEVLTEQVSYKNVGEKVREFCLRFGWGYRVTFDEGKLWFSLYKGTDRTNSVVFSEAYENLSASQYIEDDTNMGNVAIVAGEGEGSKRTRCVSGVAQSVERYEIYVDAKDISKTITWADLTAIYPTTDQGGQGYISGTEEDGYTYNMYYVNIQVIDDTQLENLRTTYPDGTLLTIDGNRYYQIYNEVIADLPSDVLEDSDSVVLRDVVYSVYLLTRGYDKLSEYGAVTSFSGTIEPNTTFEYGRDYSLGDMVTVANKFGISVGVRITEVIEVDDDNGYNVEPKFEIISKGG